MSLAWMASVAAPIALEKTVPFGQAITYATAALLFVLGVALLVAPDTVPVLMVPRDGGASIDGSMPMR
jgi:hypothetical protein